MLRAVLVGCLAATSVVAQAPPPESVVEGAIRSVPGVRLLLDADDGRLLAIVLDGDTQFVIPRAELRVGKRVRVVTARRGRGTLVAVEVLEAGAPVSPPPPPRKLPSTAMTTPDKEPPERFLRRPDTGPTPEEEELPRPVLRRRNGGQQRDLEYVEDPEFGAEVRRAGERQEEAAEEKGIVGAVEPSVSPESLHEDPLIGKAILGAHAFFESIPDFIAEQHIVRYRSGNNGRNWKEQDTVTMDVLFVDKKEFYQNVKRNGRDTSLIEAESKGQWARGDWVSTLLGILYGGSATKYELDKDATENGRDAAVYRFHIAAESSNWRLLYGGAEVRPEYRGRLWIEKDSGRVMRLEQEALNVPYEHPFNKVELTVDYDDVVIDGKRYWLPVRSQNLGCRRGTDNCARNDVEFRNYRKFSAASSVFHTESTVDFGGGKEGGSGVEPPVISEPESEKEPERR